MAFVLKKSKPVRVALGESIEDWEERKAEAEEAGEEFTAPKPDTADYPTLILKRIKAEKLLGLYAEHREVLESLAKAREEAVDGQVYISPEDVAYFTDIKEAVVEATTGWDNIVDEEGEPIEFSKDGLRELVEYDMTLYMQLMQALTAAVGTDMGAASKN